MNDWKRCTIGDLCDSVSITYRGKHEQVVLINTSDVLEGEILNHELVENKNLRGQFKKTFQKEDILYSEIRPANKRFAFVDINKTDNYIASTKLMVLRPRKSVVRPRYLFAILKSNTIINELQHLAETRSGTFPQITFSTELAPMEILLPDFDTQNRIVSLLDAVEGKIANNTAINNNLLEQATSLFKSWFVDFLPFNCSKPLTWRTMQLGDVSIMGAGGDKPKTTSTTRTAECPYPIFSNGLTDYGLYGYTNEAKIFDESVTVSARGTIGFVCLRHEPYVPIVRLVTLIPQKDLVSAKYLYLFLLQTNILGTGTTQQQLTVPDFKKTEIVVPDNITMATFTDIVSPLFNQLWANEAENNRLSQLRDALLPKLLSGELDVSEIEI